MQSVKLLSLLACVLCFLSIAVAQCPDSGIVCAIGNCCGKYYDCYNGAVHNELQRPMSAGTNCKNNQIVNAGECDVCMPFANTAATARPPNVQATTKPVQPTNAPTARPTQAPTKAPTTQAPVTQAPTKAPATQAPATQAPTKAPATQAPVTQAPTQRPTQAATKAPTKGECVAVPNRGVTDAWCKVVNCDVAYAGYCTFSSGGSDSTVAPPVVQATTKPVDGTSTKAPITITSAPTQPASNPGCKLSDVFTEQDYNTLFPHANGAAKNNVNNQHAIFNYTYLLQAASYYPDFACKGDLATRKREVAAFLAHASQESSGWWAGQPYNWGFYFSTEVGCDNTRCTQYCSPGGQYPCAPGQGYYGRGPIQLSWNYNYGAVSEALYGQGNLRLLNNPDLIFEEKGTAFRTALWFWMTEQNPKPSCHDVMTGAWNPSASDLAAGRKPGFGMTVNIVNGGIECGQTTPPQVVNRVGYFSVYTSYFGVSTGDNVYCNTMNSY